jgi:hypothetical protein
MTGDRRQHWEREEARDAMRAVKVWGIVVLLAGLFWPVVIGAIALWLEGTK